MAGETAQDQIQPLAAIKLMLNKVDKEPHPCAFALTKDRKECVLLIEKTGGAKKAGNNLKTDGKAFVEPNTLRFGTVTIDAVNDPGTVNFTVNKSEAGPTLTHIVKLVKRAGYQACVINVDPQLDEAEQAGAPPDVPPPPATAAAIDPTALKARLTALVQRMPAAIAADPSRKEALMGIAKQAQVMLGTNNLTSAAQRCDELELALGKGGANGSAGSAEGRTATKDANPAAGDFSRQWKQSFAAWQDAVETVDKQMEALGAACRKTNDPWLERIADLGLPAVTGNFKAPLMAACLEVSTAPADKVAAAAVKARSAVANFAKHIATDPQVGGCDGNPFGVPVSIRGTLGPALKSLNDALHLAR